MGTGRSTWKNTSVGYLLDHLSSYSALEAVSPKCVYYSCFTGDMYTAEDGESEPDWVQTEKKHFSEIRDTNKVKDP